MTNRGWFCTYVVVSLSLGKQIKTNRFFFFYNHFRNEENYSVSFLMFNCSFVSEAVLSVNAILFLREHDIFGENNKLLSFLGSGISCGLIRRVFGSDAVVYAG